MTNRWTLCASRTLAIAVFILLASLASAGSTQPMAAAQGPASWPTLNLRKIAWGIDKPVDLAQPGDGTRRLFASGQRGVIYVIDLDREDSQATEFMDIRDRVSCCGERGLHSIAFPPGFPAKPYFYALYTDLQGDTTLSRFHLTDDSSAGDPTSEQVLLVIAEPGNIHAGSQLVFGPADGYLYVGKGDGRGGGDPLDMAQNPDSLLGKILRIDTETGAQPYAIPASNPFTQTLGYRPEIWALGVRNPWRISFDRATHDMYFSDVGEANWEEIDFQPASSAGGENYGWRIVEGDSCFQAETCDRIGLTPPIWTYSHEAGCAAIGGYTYRGERFSALRGIYLYADYCNGWLFGLRRAGDSWISQPLVDSGFLYGITSFGEDQAGELYLTEVNNGEIYRVEAFQRAFLPMIRK